jgi:hypothetical protein
VKQIEHEIDEVVRRTAIGRGLHCDEGGKAVGIHVAEFEVEIGLPQLQIAQSHPCCLVTLRLIKPRAHEAHVLVIDTRVNAVAV